jgi:hypothetical protein
MVEAASGLEVRRHKAAVQQIARAGLGAELGRYHIALWDGAFSDGGDGSGWSGRGCLARDSAANVVGVGAQRATQQRAGEVEDEGVKGVVSAWTAISESAKRAGSSGYLMCTLRLLHSRLRG